MTDHRIPDDLLDELARKIVDGEEWCCNECRDAADLPHDSIRDLLAALSEWADGALIDPRRWQRVTATESGVDYCDHHAGIREADEHRCDNADWCTACNGNGGTYDDAQQWVDCAACNGTGWDPCDLIGAVALSPVPEEPTP